MNPTTIAAPPKKQSFSYSRLLMYTDCPLAYKLSYVDKVGTDESGALQVGSAAHLFFEKWHAYLEAEGKRSAQLQDQPLLITFTEAELEAKVLAMAAECFQAEPRDQANFKDFLDICRAFAKSYVLDTSWESHAEFELAFTKGWHRCSWYSPEVYFRGKIDLLQIRKNSAGDVVEARVTDYKTGFGGNVDQFQLDIYAFSLSKLYPKLERVEVVFHYTRSDHKARKTLEMSEMGVTQIQIEALTARIESDTKWKAKPGSRCLNCPVAGFCNMKATNLVKIAAPKDAELLAAEIAMLEAQAKSKKQSLKKWVEINGEVRAEGLVYGFSSSESYVLPIPEFIRFCVEKQLDPSSLLSANTTNIKKLVKKNPELGNELAPLISVEVSQSFKAKKDKGSDE